MHACTTDTPISRIRLSPRQVDVLDRVRRRQVWSAFDSADADVTIRDTDARKAWRSVTTTVRTLTVGGLVERAGTRWVLTPAGRYVLLRNGGGA